MTYREILGVGPDADLSEIKHAYRKLVIIHHPDKGGDHETFVRIQNAYEELTQEKPFEGDLDEFIDLLINRIVNSIRFE